MTAPKTFLYVRELLKNEAACSPFEKLLHTYILPYFMRVLIACEHSGIIRNAFAASGHAAWSCDFLPSDLPGNHYQCDVREILNDYWDLIIAHPDCTFMTNSGVCHLHSDASRWIKLFDAADFFKLFLNHKCPRICIENPIMHKYAKQLIGVNQTQVIQPYQFGHLERKATCLWLKGLPKLQPTNDVKTEMLALPKNQQQRLHYLSPSPERWKIRSKTFSGIATAMSQQWGQPLESAVAVDTFPLPVKNVAVSK